jgi:5'-nucleotidase
MENALHPKRLGKAAQITASSYYHARSTPDSLPDGGQRQAWLGRFRGKALHFTAAVPESLGMPKKIKTVTLGLRIERLERLMKLRRMMWALAFCVAALQAARADDFKLKIIALNDFHGNLQSPGKYRASAQSPEVPSGGADFLAGYVQHLKSENPTNIVVAAGDLVGASPLASGLFHDEGAIEAMNRLGLEISSVGNHEFDKGKKELLRLQHGGCSTVDENTCKGAITGTPVPFEGAKFEYLSANVFDTSTGKTLFPAYAVKAFHGARVAFIGLTLKDTPALVDAKSVAGLRFEDEAATINASVQQLQKQGVKIFVVLIHQGGMQTTKGTVDINACEGELSGSPIASIVSKLDDAVDLVISAHTHAAYICKVPNRAGRKILVTSAASYGRLLTEIDMTIDTQSAKAVDLAARNIVVDRTNAAIAPDTALKAMVEKYAALAAPIANRKVGSISADLTKMQNANGESSLGDVIADAQLESTSATGSGGAVVAFMNPGGIRTDLPFASGLTGVKDGDVTYGELFQAQPFANTLVTMNLTGEQIKILLEEQFKGCALGAQSSKDTAPSTDRILQVSEGFTYTWNAAGPVCGKVDAGSIKVNGMAVAPSAKIRVTVNSFLADGGEELYILRQGTERLGGPADLDALAAYFAKHPSIAPVAPHRISVVP